MNAANSPPCWESVVFLVLEDNLFLNRESQIFWFFLFRIFLEILVVNHEKFKKQKQNVESHLAFSKKPKNKQRLRLIRLDDWGESIL